MKPRVLVVEDEPSISEPLASHLGREGFAPEVAASIADARAAFVREEPDVVLLDVMLPDGDGRDLCREWRSASDVPIVMLTARGEEVDRVVGLELGADDYVTKPFSPREIVARIRAILRRGSSDHPSDESTIAVGDLVIDRDRREVRRSGEVVAMTRKEFDLL